MKKKKKPSLKKALKALDKLPEESFGNVGISKEDLEELLREDLQDVEEVLTEARIDKICRYIAEKGIEKYRKKGE